MRADMKTELHYYVKGALSYSEFGKEAIIRNFRTTTSGSVFDAGGVLDATI
jgi:hypothetical protein